MNDYDVLIAGSGVAGLYAALNFAPETRVLVLSKRELTLCNSFLAQGGVAAVVDKENDDYRLHIADTLIAGGYKNDLRSLEILVNEGPEDVLRLVKEMGVDFDQDSAHRISMTLEGGHSRRRILHHKDSTGREITEKLLAMAQSKPNITLMENAQLAALTPAEGGFWAGLLTDGGYRALTCSYCVLCTGGIGRVYPYTTNSAIATGDGIMFAYNMGARIKNLSLVQFHPTAFANHHTRECFLISEAVRGEGAYLLNCRGERFMARYDNRLELAPRDVVSKAIIEESHLTGSDHFYLDISHKDPEFLKKRFPMIYQNLLKEGFDLTKDRIPIFPCQHYLMGGIDVDTDGQTTLDGLYAAGECSHTGVHGNNRLASNSLLEALVFSHRAADHINGRLNGSLPELVPQPFSENGEGEPLPHGLRTEIRAIMQHSHFVVRDKAAAQKGFARICEIKKFIEEGHFALTPDYVEARALATVAYLILQEVA